MLRKLAFIFMIWRSRKAIVNLLVQLKEVGEAVKESAEDKKVTKEELAVILVELNDIIPAILNLMGVK